MAFADVTFSTVDLAGESMAGVGWTITTETRAGIATESGITRASQSGVTDRDGVGSATVPIAHPLILTIFGSGSWIFEVEQSGRLQPADLRELASIDSRVFESGVVRRLTTIDGGILVTSTDGTTYTIPVPTIMPAYHRTQKIATQTFLTDVAEGGDIENSSYILATTQTSIVIPDPAPSGVTIATDSGTHWIRIPAGDPPTGINAVIVDVDGPDGTRWLSSAIPWMNVWGREIVNIHPSGYFYCRAATDGPGNTALAIQFGDGTIPAATVIEWWYARL